MPNSGRRSTDSPRAPRGPAPTSPAGSPHCIGRTGPRPYRNWSAPWTPPDALVVLRYLGAASAGIGEDRDAAGAWALSLTAPDVTADWHLAHANALVRAQDSSGAINALADAAAHWPGDGRMSARRGELLLAAGRVDEARSDLQQALAQEPDHERTLFLLTVVAFADVAASATPDDWGLAYMRKNLSDSTRIEVDNGSSCEPARR